MVKAGIFSAGKFGVVPDPYEYPEFEGCTDEYNEDNCDGCGWKEVCKRAFDNENKE